MIPGVTGTAQLSPCGAYRYPSPQGPGNDETVFAQASQASAVVAAWGAAGSQPRLASRRSAVLTALSGIPLWCSGVTKAAEPRHPLMVRTETPLTPWEAR